MKPIDNLSMFEVVPEDYDAEAERAEREAEAFDLSNIDFMKRALDDGYGQSVIDQAASLATGNTKSYEDFERLIDKVVNDIEREKSERIAKERRRAQSIKIEIDRIRGLEDPIIYLEDLIHKHYNTTAVSGLELLDSLKSHPDLNLELYVDPVVSVILQLNQDWVSDAINECLVKWDTNTDVVKYIESYCLVMDMECSEKNLQGLISLLPDSIRNEQSPKLYKVFRAIQLSLSERSGSSNYIFQDEDNDDQYTYTSSLEGAYSNGAPFKMSEAMASDAVYEKKGISSVVAGTGKAFGKVINFKYKLAQDFDAAVRESLGDNADEYYRRKELKKQAEREDREREDELRRQEREELKAEKQAAKQEARMQNNAYSTNYNNRSNYNGRNNYSRNNNTYNRNRNSASRYGSAAYAQRRDFAPQIPLPVMALFIHVVVFLLVYLLLGSSKALLLGIGLIMATIGWFKKQQANDSNSIALIAFGYILVVVGILFIFK